MSHSPSDNIPHCETSILDQVTGEPNPCEINHAVTQISTILMPFHCDIPAAKDHGFAWIIVNETQWILKHGVDETVPIPAHPGPHTGTTHATKFIHEQDVRQHESYKQHRTGAICMLEHIFQPEVFLDLQDLSLIHI